MSVATSIPPLPPKPKTRPGETKPPKIVPESTPTTKRKKEDDEVKMNKSTGSTSTKKRPDSKKLGNGSTGGASSSSTPASESVLKGSKKAMKVERTESSSSGTESESSEEEVKKVAPAKPAVKPAGASTTASPKTSKSTPSAPVQAQITKKPSSAKIGATETENPKKTKSVAQGPAATPTKPKVPPKPAGLKESTSATKVTTQAVPAASAGKAPAKQGVVANSSSSSSSEQDDDETSDESVSGMTASSGNHPSSSESETSSEEASSTTEEDSSTSSEEDDKPPRKVKAASTATPASPNNTKTTKQQPPEPQQTNHKLTQSAAAASPNHKKSNNKAPPAAVVEEVSSSSTSSSAGATSSGSSPTADDDGSKDVIPAVVVVKTGKPTGTNAAVRAGGSNPNSQSSGGGAASSSAQAAPGKNGSHEKDKKKKSGGFFGFFKSKHKGDKAEKHKGSGANAGGHGSSNTPNPHRDNNVPTPDKRKPEEEKKTFVASCVADLPDDWQKKLKKAHLDEELLNTYFPVLCNVLHFLTKHSFRIPDQEKEVRERRTYASNAMMDAAKGIMETTDNIKRSYKNIEFSGKGGFGRVFAAKDVITKKRVAIKKLPHLTDKDKKNNYCEIGFLSTCSHANIVRFIKAWDFPDKGEAWIVTEFLEGGTLSEAVKVHLFSERHIAYVAREILKALKYLHSLGYVHRDLKSGNVMMSIEGHIKLIDFGLCCDTVEGPRLQMLGSPYWIPPEMIKKQRHGCPADIWSFAVCVLEMYLKEPPNCESRLYAMFTAASQGLKTAIPPRASDNARDFLSHCLEINPKKRWTAEQLLEHPFVTQPKLEEGIRDVLRGVFVSNSLALSGI